MKSKTHNILAFIPPNKHGRPVLREALYLQRSLGMKIFVINIIKAPSFYEKIFQAIKINDMVDRAENEMNDFIKAEFKNDITKGIKTVIRAGETVSTLLDEVNTGRYEFVLVDKSNADSTVGFCLKRINDFVGESKIPVLSLHNDFGVSKIENIVIPIDITESTKKRLLWANFFAKKYGAKITVLSALNANIEPEKSLAYKNANSIKHLFWENNVDCDVKVLRTCGHDKHQVILEYIEEANPELVIIRTHQDSLLRNRNIGEFVSKIIHGCRVPVLSVNYSTNPFDSFF